MLLRRTHIWLRMNDLGFSHNEFIAITFSVNVSALSLICVSRNKSGESQLERNQSSDLANRSLAYICQMWKLCLEYASPVSVEF